MFREIDFLISRVTFLYPQHGFVLQRFIFEMEIGNDHKVSKKEEYDKGNCDGTCILFCIFNYEEFQYRMGIDTIRFWKIYRSVSALICAKLMKFIIKLKKIK